MVYGRAPNADKNLDTLNGVRVIAICWVILGHTYYYMLAGPIENPEKVLSFFDEYSFTFIMSAPYSVDVFFWLSGFLGCYIMLTTMHRKKGRMQPYYLILLHRLIRLWPMYVSCMLIFWGFMKYFGSGPVFYQFSELAVDECNKSWWSHLLFINNFYPIPDDCMGWTWYLANDFQFFLITPPIIWLMY